MAVWALGINHNTAPLDLRGRFAFAIDQIQPTLMGLRESLAGRVERGPEAAILSTCNRTEIYCAGERHEIDHTLDWLAHSGGVSPILLRSHAYTLQDDFAARHAFRVASGLDSMVLGEPQILGQMKDAVRAADEAGALGHHAEPAVPALVCCRQGGANLHRDRRAFHQHGRCRGAPGRPALRRPGQDSRAVRGCRRNDRTGSHPLCRQEPQNHRHCQPHAGAWRKAGRVLAARSCACRSCPAPARVRRRGELHCQHPAHHRPGRRGACAQAPQAPPHVHGRPGRAARHRARGQGPGRHLSLHRRRPGACGADRPGQPPGRRGSRPRPSSTRACRASCTGWTSAAPCR
jgi:hypothetical protein